MNQPVLALISAWRAEAQRLRDRYADEGRARLSEVHAVELETALREALDRELTLDEASELSGHSKSNVRRLLDQGEIPNVGGPGIPRVRLRDLPFKTGRMTAERALTSRQERRPGKLSVRKIGPRAT